MTADLRNLRHLAAPADQPIEQEHPIRPDPQSQGSDILGDLGTLVESWKWPIDRLRHVPLGRFTIGQRAAFRQSCRPVAERGTRVAGG